MEQDLGKIRGRIFYKRFLGPVSSEYNFQYPCFASEVHLKHHLHIYINLSFISALMDVSQFFFECDQHQLNGNYHVAFRYFVYRECRAIGLPIFISFPILYLLHFLHMPPAQVSVTMRIKGFLFLFTFLIALTQVLRTGLVLSMNSLKSSRAFNVNFFPIGFGNFNAQIKRPITSFLSRTHQLVKECYSCQQHLNMVTAILLLLFFSSTLFSSC